MNRRRLIYGRGQVDGAITTSISHIGNHSDFDHASASDLTISSAGLGAADSNRRVVVTVGYYSGSLATISSLTIGGVSATLIKRETNTSLIYATADIWAASVPTGTTGDIVASFSASVSDLSFDVYRMLKSGGFTANDTGSDSNDLGGGGTTYSLDLNTTVDGCAVTCAMSINASASTPPSGFTEATDVDINSGSDEWVASSYITGIASAETPRSMNLVYSAGADAAAVSASWT